MRNVIDCVSNRDIVFVSGDINCKGGGLHIKEPNLVGKRSNIERGYIERGKTLTLTFAICGYLLANKLRIPSISYAYVNQLCNLLEILMFYPHLI